MPPMKSPWIVPFLLLGAVVVLMAVDGAPAPSETDGSRFVPAQRAALAPPKTGEELYREACANCHGPNGAGAPRSQVAFDAPLPDFTDCNFATREPDGDWIAVAHQGGPTRGFSENMPAFGDALTEAQLQKIMDHIRSMCPNDDWPRGELNLPRPLVTEKAYPEDEAVLTSSVDVENEGAVMNEFVYERRFGVRNQLEVVVPFGFQERADGRWSGGHLGDVAIGTKRAVYHSLENGSIFSLTGEVLLPTGAEEQGFGTGTTVFEPFASYGQILPAGGFLHVQGGAEIPLTRSTQEAFFRGTLGKSFASGRWGRTWSPMVEVLGSRDLESSATTHWDLAPQMQVTLNTRQHVMLNVGVQIPVDDPGRDTRVTVYLLWDWFDGGFLEGW
jgi:mono/diheme cytochrome c family protein